MEGKWTLEHGTHKGTLMSRDVCAPQHFDTEQEALTSLSDQKKFYRKWGYVIWFAYLTSPDGTKRELESNSNYW
jgi:hypothetical protein